MAWIPVVATGWQCFLCDCLQWEVAKVCRLWLSASVADGRLVWRTGTMIKYLSVPSTISRYHVVYTRPNVRCCLQRLCEDYDMQERLHFQALRELD